MKLSDFKRAIADYRESKMGFDINDRHTNILLIVKNGSEETPIDYVFVDRKKNRIFYVGKSKELKQGFFSRKTPMELNADKFFQWSEKESRYDSFEVYFAWNYDYKDQELFDYAPMTNYVSAEPSRRNLKAMEFAVDPKKSFKVKVRNLHEKLLKKV